MRIALLEIGGSHDECLYSQVLFLKSKAGVYLSLICDATIHERVSSFSEVDELITVTSSGGLKGYLELVKLRRILINGKYDLVVLNTAQGSLMKKLLTFPFPSSIRFIGTLHNISRLRKSTGQRIISKRVRSYYVLSEYLLDKVQRLNEQTLSFANYYPIYFNEIPIREVSEKEDDLWICIPGQVEYKRRDYEGLLSSLDSDKLHKRLKFILLGRCTHSHGDGSRLKAHLQAKKLDARFILWDDFIDASTFSAYLKTSDYIMPLIHPGHPSGDIYEQQITGAFNLAYGHRKTLLMDQSFSELEEFKDSSWFYDSENLSEALNNLVENRPQASYATDRWDFEKQCEKYWKFIERQNL